MDITMLREFIILSKTLNYTKAAETLHLAQPTLSKHITSMEKELGCQLFERNQRQVCLTDSGNIFVNAAMQIVDTYDKAQLKIIDIQHYHPLKIDGAINENNAAAIMSIAATFLDQEGIPAPEVSADEEGNSDALERLGRDEIDLAISYADLDKLDALGLAYIPLTRSHFVAVITPDNQLSGMKQISLDDLRNYRFIRYVDRYAANGWANIEAVCQLHGFTPQTRTVWKRATVNYCSEHIGDDEVLILNSNNPQLRYLSDFSQTIAIPVSDDDAIFHLYLLFRKEREEELRPVLEAYTRARKIVIHHGDESLLTESE